ALFPLAMCGRITLTRPNLESVASQLNVAHGGCRGYPILEPHYNIAPTSVHPILRLDGSGRSISPMTWGSIPRSGRGLTINWRSESFLPKAPRCGLSPTGSTNGAGERTPATLLRSTSSRAAGYGSVLEVAAQCREYRTAGRRYCDHARERANGAYS